MYGDEKVPPAAVEGRLQGMYTGTSSNISHYENNVKLSIFLQAVEFAALSEFMITGKTSKNKYCDLRNQYIYETMVFLMENNGYVDTESLINYLTEYDHVDHGLERSGGADYLQSILGSYESEYKAMVLFLSEAGCEA
jgi:hypothetical protein